MFDLFCNMWKIFSIKELSPNTVNCYKQFINSLYDDIGHPDCTEYCGSYLVEYGYNFKK